MNPSQSDEEVAEAILGYLAEHPQAMDTAKGIAEWWIMRQQIRVNVNRLKRVLREMADKGLLEELGTEEQPRYRLNR